MTYLNDLAQRIRARVPAGVDVPDDSDDLFVLYAVLARVKGAEITSHDVHDAWVAWMVIQDEEHESMVPFDELDEATRAEDEPFATAIRGTIDEA